MIIKIVKDNKISILLGDPSSLTEIKSLIKK